jgi:hypothetical protein
MFGDVALNMLKLMGHSATVPGALLAEDIPAALQRLEAEIKANRQLPESDQPENGEDDDAVSLSHRALPLIELLKAAAKAKTNIMWDSNS